MKTYKVFLNKNAFLNFWYINYHTYMAINFILKIQIHDTAIFGINYLQYTQNIEGLMCSIDGVMQGLLNAAPCFLMQRHEWLKIIDQFVLCSTPGSGSCRSWLSICEERFNYISFNFRYFYYENLKYFTSIWQEKSLIHVINKRHVTVPPTRQSGMLFV